MRRSVTRHMEYVMDGRKRRNHHAALASRGDPTGYTEASVEDAIPVRFR